MGAGPGSWSAVLLLAPVGGRGPRPLGARGGDALKVTGTCSWILTHILYFFLYFFLLIIFKDRRQQASIENKERILYRLCFDYMKAMNEITC